METIQQLFEIIIRKRQPEDLSYNLSAAVTCVIVVIGLGTIVYSKVPYFSQPLAYNLTMVLAQALAIYGLLAMRKKSTRFVQTITAIFGVSAILQILTIGAGLTVVLAATGLLFTIWNMVLIVIILRSALECSTIQAIIQTIAYHFLMVIALMLLFPKFPLELKAMVEASQATIEASQTVKPGS